MTETKILEHWRASWPSLLRRGISLLELREDEDRWLLRKRTSTTTRTRTKRMGSLIQTSLCWIRRCLDTWKVSFLPPSLSFFSRRVDRPLADFPSPPPSSLRQRQRLHQPLLLRRFSNSSSLRHRCRRRCFLLCYRSLRIQLVSTSSAQTSLAFRNSVEESTHGGHA